MKKTLTLLLLLSARMAWSQTQVFSCTAGERSLEQLQAHPERLVTNEQLEAFTKEYIKQHHGEKRNARSGPTYVIPCVFHILHDGGREMLSDSIIYKEMRQWNEFMSATCPEIGNVVSAFDTLVGVSDIEFRLAQRDPNGVCTNGIDRIYTQTTYNGNDNNKVRPWPREKYLNVWLINTMSRSNAGALAYAYYPSSVSTYFNNHIIDGVIAMAESIGGDAPYSKPTLGHECGHWMNLEHIWGSTNSPGVACGDDGVADTPPTKGSYGVCNVNRNYCNPPVIENEQNIMNYSNCHFMFTLGQVDRMHAALNSTVSGRSNLWSQANLLATGTDQPLTYPNPQSCAIPIADFTASKRYICVGESVKFSDASYNGTVDTRVWTFPTDATVSSNTDAKTTVTFNSPGWQQISLEVANANGSNQKTKAMVFVVDPAQAISAPFYESFENAATAQARWQAINYDNNNTSFQYFNQGGHYSQSCYKLNYYDNNLDGDKDDLASPAFDLSNLALSDLKFSFEYSFATTDVTHLTDTSAALAVFASKDCGATWSRLYYKVGYGLFNAGVQIGGYTPGLDNQYWKKITLTLPTSFQTNSVVFRVQVTSAVDINHFYIENINIGNTTNTGLTDTKLDIESIDIVPNPSIGQATLMLESADASDVDIHLFDIQGRDMANVYQGAINAGTNQIPLNVQSLAAGVYLVHVSDGKNSIQKRFVKM